MQSCRSAQFREDVGRIFAGKSLPVGDGALLDAFVGRRDEAAFGALVERHGPMVRGVCRRILPAEADADDAFQATFLVLILKASRIGDASRLAPWLYGVARREALKARARIARLPIRLDLEASGIDPAAPTPDLDRLDLLPTIDAEIARLPAKLREAVILCLVEGATPDEAAQRLGCPVGTVKSRLARGRDALRSRLTRRGVTPALAFATLDRVAPSNVPAALVRLTLAAASAPALAPALIALTRGVTPAMLLKSTAAALLAGGLALTGNEWAAAPAPRSAQAQAPAPTRAAPLSQPAAPSAGASTPQPPADRPIADRLAAIVAESKAHSVALYADADKVPAGKPQSAIINRLFADEVAACRRVNDLVQEEPAIPAARDALLWVVDMPNRGPAGDYGDEAARAGSMLVRHHGDDPDAVAVGLGLNNWVSPQRDALLFGFVAAAKGREARGIARLALARYFDDKAVMADIARMHPERQQFPSQEIGDDGKPHATMVDESDERYATKLSLRAFDPAGFRAEAERLDEEVIRDYADIPYVTLHHRKLVALMAEADPQWNGRSLTADERQQIGAVLAQNTRKTLGSVAAAHLDDLRNLVVGKPAPEIDGPTLDGGTLKLSDRRGKVVVLVFWGSWCGPCLGQIPQERDLAAKYQGRPFALLGVDCRDKQEAARKVVQDEKITWPNWHDGPGDGTDGPIARRYHVPHYPYTVVIDAQGMIRHKELSGTELDEAVAKLLAEAEPKTP